MPVHHNEDIYKRTFTFSVRIVRLAQHMDEKPGVSRTLSRQLLRSGTSIGANLEEAKAGQSRADFIHKLEISLKESRETVYWLRLITASEILPAHRISELQIEAEEISKVLAAIIVSTKKRSRIIKGGIAMVVLPLLTAMGAMLFQF